VRGLVLLDQQQRDPLYERVAVAAGTLQLISGVDERAAVAGAGEVG